MALRALALAVLAVGAVAAERQRRRPYEGLGGRLRRKVAREERQSFTLQLALRDADALDATLAALHDPAGPRFRQWLSPQEFGERHGASGEQLRGVRAFLRAHNLTERAVDASRLFVDVEGTTGDVNAAFQTEMARFTRTVPREDGTAGGGRHLDEEEEEEFTAPLVEPVIPSDLGIKEVFGLEDLGGHAKPYVRRSPAEVSARRRELVDFGRGMTPETFRRAYGVSDSETGEGQTIAIIQFTRYVKQDFVDFCREFGITKPPQIVDVDLGKISEHPAEQVEASLDMQLVAAMAPRAAKIIHYNGPNTAKGALDVLRRMADDNLASQGSVSWGAPERTNNIAGLEAEAALYKQMAAQGQSFFAASGDYGAFDGGEQGVLRVDSPASMVWVTGVGGTTLTHNDGQYVREKTWWSGRLGGGGGVSQVWKKPAFQNGFGAGAMRNVPDVALHSDSAGAYWIRNSGFWTTAGGTSAAAPIWAGLCASINARRAKSGNGRLGNFNQVLYPLMKNSATYKSTFNDISDNSDNGYYAARTGYDMATGFGSFKGSNLIRLLSEAEGSGEEPTDAPTGKSPRNPTKRPISGRAPTSRPTKKTNRATKTPTAMPLPDVAKPTKKPVKNPTAQGGNARTRFPTNRKSTRTPTAMPLRDDDRHPTKKPAFKRTKTPTAMPLRDDDRHPTKKPAFKRTKTPTAMPLREEKTDKPTPRATKRKCKRGKKCPRATAPPTPKGRKTRTPTAMPQRSE